MTEKVNIFWFRRDLRLSDNLGLYEALQDELPVLPIFIFDTQILDELPEHDARVNFIYAQVQLIRNELLKQGSSLAMYHGTPLEIFKQLTTAYQLQHVYCNHDYEAYSCKRDEAVAALLSEKGIGFHTFKDHVIFEKDEIVKENGEPYVVYTPYMKTWKANFNVEQHLKEYDPTNTFHKLVQDTSLPNLDLADLGFVRSNIEIPAYDVSKELIASYQHKRNFPAKHGTSRLGPHLRFGTVSIRQVIRQAMASHNETFLNELIWREFFIQILYHYPSTVHNAFRAKYDRVLWRNNEAEFELWKSGHTGYPLVDAGMRELNETGYMHNRVRMVVASFLCKHLLIDWRWGEAYFAEKLLDYEQASNVGNWQWAAGSGVDAAPYFRIFNPTTQIEKFDKERLYIKKWVKEIDDPEYPQQVVDHKFARERALTTYKNAIK